jgi:hypothetical protein
MNFVLRYNFQYKEIRASSADHAIEKAREFLKENKIAFAYLFKNHLVNSFICSLELVKNHYEIR